MFAVYPNANGFGFVYMENARKLLDYGAVLFRFDGGCGSECRTTVRCVKCHATFNAAWHNETDKAQADWHLGRG